MRPSLCLLCLLLGCGKTDDSASVDTGLATDSTTATDTSADNDTSAETDTGGCIAPSADDQTTVQTALIEAASGDTICLAAGTFSFHTELSLAVDGVTLQGAGSEQTILDFNEQDVGANGIVITSDDVILRDLQVRDTPGDGVRATEVERISFLDMSVIWTKKASVDNGAYGLYPVGCTGVLIDGALVVGARDAGIYVGQSNRILVANSEAYGNVAGIEIENSTDAEVRDNHVHDNTAGVLIFNLPDLPVQDGKRAKVHSNLIENNNLDNFAAKGTIVADVPPGVGTFIIAADDNELHDNTISGHRTTGSLVLSYSELVFGSTDDKDFDLWAEGNWTHDNSYENNGYDPTGDLAAFIVDRPVPDLVFDGCIDPAKKASEDLRNCFSNNGKATYYDVDVCGFLQDQSTDISEVDCTQDALPSIDPIP